jgi:hypothetical protein
VHQWQPVQHAAIASGPRRVSALCRGQRPLSRDSYKRIQRFAMGFDAGEKCPGQLNGREVAAFKAGGELRQCLCVQFLAHTSLDNFGHEVKPTSRFRGILLHMIPIVHFCDLIRAQALRGVEGVRHRHDGGGIRLRQLVDEIDDSRQLLDRFAEFVIG